MEIVKVQLAGRTRTYWIDLEGDGRTFDAVAEITETNVGGTIVESDRSLTWTSEPPDADKHERAIWEKIDQGNGLS